MDDTSETLETFIRSLAAIPWFAAVGRPTDDGRLPRILSWDAPWNPEDPSTATIHLRQQELFDDIVATSPNAGETEALFERVRRDVETSACRTVPYDPSQDCYHAPNAAVWHAAWTAGLVALCREAGRPLPAELGAQWALFRLGHWPAAFAAMNDMDEPLDPAEFDFF